MFHSWLFLYADTRLKLTQIELIKMDRYNRGYN